MRNNNIIYRILKLDKSVYSELVMDPSSGQRAGAIWVVSYLISILSAFTLIRNFSEFLKSNLSLIASGLPEESLIELVQMRIHKSLKFERSFGLFLTNT